MTAPFADFLRTPDGYRFKDRVREALRRDVEGLAEALFGRPNPSRNRKQLRFAGGLIVELAGNKRGRWYSHTAQQGGYEPQLIAFARGCDQTAAWEWAGHYTGIEPKQRRWTPEEQRAWLERQKREREARERARIAAEARERAARIGIARQKWAEGEPIEALSEKYLVATRGIPAPEAGWPHDVIRFHRGDRAIMFALYNDAGELQAVHCVYLTSAATNLRRPDGSKKKLTFGPLDGVVVRLPGKHGFRAPLQRAEGPETGLTGWAATGYATWVLLGPLSNKPPPRGRLVIDLRDDDAAGSKVDQRYQEALAEWRVDRLDVWPATPWPEPRGDKSDFNDVGREAGLDAVHQRIRLAELEAYGLKPAAAPFPLPTATVAEIRSTIAKTVNNLFAHRDQAPRVLLRAATGTRKTETIGELLPSYILVDKANGRPHRVIILTPMHHLSHQIAARYREMGLNAATYEGRGDPWDDAEESALCTNMAEVKLATIAQEDITSAVCKNREAQCRGFLGCKYFQQLDRAIAADVCVLAHNFIFQPLPPKLFADVGTVIIEEDFSSQGDGTTELPIAVFASEMLWKHPVLNKEDAATDYSATDDLQELYGKIERALGAAAAGRSTLREALTAGELSAADIEKARKLTWRCKQPKGMSPAMPLEDRQEIARKAKHHLTLPKIATALYALEEIAKNANSADLNALLSFDSDPVGNGSFSFNGDWFTVHRLKKHDDWLKQLPVLIPSATARPDLVERFFPSLQIVAPPPPALPHQTTRQRRDSFGKEAVREKLPELVVDIALEAVQGGQVVVITHMQDEAELNRRLKDVPGDIRVLHHGGTVGDNDFRDARVIFQFGGPFPRPTAVLRQASAEQGRLIAPEKPVRMSCRNTMIDGTGVEFERLGYTNPDLQRVHAGIYDASFIQGALGRGRGLHRTAANPLTIYVYANAPLNAPVTTIEPWRKPSRLAKMMLRGHVPLGAADMRRFYPDLFRSEDVARQAKHRWGGEAEIKAELRRLADRMPWPSVLVTWQPQGQGHKTRLDIVARPQIEERRSAAEREFGGLVAWRVEPFSRGACPFKPTAEECDVFRKEILFPKNVTVISGSQQAPALISSPPPPRAPPDG
jgi:putative DNA primase/helicase